jgi:mono/diheme cytochrome c family protein
MKSHFTVLAVLGALFLSMPALSQMGMMNGGGMMNSSTVRHQYVMHNGVDTKYASKKNPLKNTTENTGAGKKLYGQNCASCHGPKGLGDGEVGKSLNPRPANIASSIKMPMATDGFLYWTIAEGGVPLHTAMPPFKGVLKEDDVLKVILYIRGL